MSRSSIAIIDRDGRLVAILAGHPDDKTWPEVRRQAARLLEKARQRCRMKEEEHRRGIFYALRCGVSHGGGQTAPRNLSCKNAHNAKILAALSEKVAFRRINGFTNSKSPLCHFFITA